MQDERVLSLSGNAFQKLAAVGHYMILDQLEHAGCL